MNNPLEALSIFRIVAPKSTTGERAAFGWITIRYGATGTAQAFYNYEQRPTARATGGGYDKTGAALGKAVEKLLHVTLEADGAADYVFCIEQSRGLLEYDKRDVDALTKELEDRGYALAPMTNEQACFEAGYRAGMREARA